MRRRLKINDWPAQDRDVWTAMLQPGGLLRQGGAFAHLRVTTLWTREQAYGHWLAFCQQQGIDLEATDPVARATDHRISAWAESMSDLAWTTRHNRLVGLLLVLEGMQPDQSPDLLRDLVREVEWHVNRQTRQGKTGRILPTGQIVDAGLAHLGSVDGTGFRDATRFRDGLIVATLALLTLRITTFRDLEIGRSFLVRPSGFDVALDADETKNHRAHDTELPGMLFEPMQRYLDLYRPTLLAQSEALHGFLWVNDWGNRYSHGNLGARISRLTKKLLGIAIPPHYMRDAAATTIARAAPSQSRAIAGALGHATLRTADRYYNQARCLDASRAYTPFIEELVEDAASKRSRRTRTSRRQS